MSNKSRLQTNNTNLQALIDKANALPDAGGGSGGGSVETCAVGFVNSSETTCSVYGTYYENGAFSSYPISISTMSSRDMEVIKNSFIVISSNASAVDVININPILTDKTTISGASIVAVENYESIRINILDE